MFLMCVFFIPKLGHDGKNGLINEVKKRRKTVIERFFSLEIIVCFFFLIFKLIDIHLFSLQCKVLNRSIEHFGGDRYIEY